MAKCETCGTEIKPGIVHKHKGRLYVYQGKAVCQSCLVDAGVPISEATAYDAYVKIHTDFHRGGINI
jgi:hypothetical protein